MTRLLLKFAKFIYSHIKAFCLDYEDEDVKELGDLINELELNIEENKWK